MTENIHENIPADIPAEPDDGPDTAEHPVVPEPTGDEDLDAHGDPLDAEG
jgi:hypothetical protein